jgi:hypothetical protein
MLSPKLNVDIVLLDETDRQWRCTSPHQSAYDDDCWNNAPTGNISSFLSVCFPWSFKFCKAQIDNKTCETWLSVGDKPLSLERLEPLNRCIFLAGSLAPYFYVFTFLYNARNKMMNASLFYFYATTASRLMGFMPQIYLHGA